MVQFWRVVADLRTLTLHITFFFTLIAGAAFAQQDVVDETRIAIKSGSAKGLVAYFDNTVDLKVNEKEVSYSRSQAEFVIKEFFKVYAPTSYVVNHIGSSPGGAKYCIGSYNSAHKKFRVYMKMKKIGATYKVDTLHFTEE